jgi:hypothetical protein
MQVRLNEAWLVFAKEPGGFLRTVIGDFLVCGIKRFFEMNTQVKAVMVQAGIFILHSFAIKNNPVHQADSLGSRCIKVCKSFKVETSSWHKFSYQKLCKIIIIYDIRHQNVFIIAINLSSMMGYTKKYFLYGHFGQLK